MPLILYSYLIAEILAPFFASLIILNGVLFTGRMMQVIDLMFNLNIGLTDFLRLCAYLSPNLLLFSMPMASTMAVIIAFNRLTSDNEVIALKAAGIGLYKMLPPVIIFALCTTLTTGYFSTNLIPAGTVAMQNLFIKLATEKINKGVQAKRFSEHTGDIVLYIDEVDRDTQQWQGVYLSDQRDKNSPITVVAKSGSITSHLEQMYITLDLQDGSLHRSEDDTTQTITFERYKINLPIKPPKAIGGESSSGISKSSMSQKQLLKYAAKYGKNTPKGVDFLVEYHKRLALPVGCFILSILGLPLALRGRAIGRNISIPLGLAFFIAYYIAITAAKGYCDQASVPVALIMWLPNLLFGTITLAILTITAAENWDKVTKYLTKWPLSFRKC